VPRDPRPLCWVVVRLGQTTAWKLSESSQRSYLRLSSARETGSNARMTEPAMTQTSIVYLLGSPGVGKRTIARALARRTGAVVIDNQTVNIPVMALFDWDGRSLLPPQIWAYIGRIRDAMLSALQDVAPRQLSYMLTNALEQNEESEAPVHTCPRYRHCTRGRVSARAPHLPVAGATPPSGLRRSRGPSENVGSHKRGGISLRGRRSTSHGMPVCSN
jgi:hypothetical protein